MSNELIERAIEMLKWAAEDDANFLQWEKSKSTDKIDAEMIEHLSWLVEERTDIVNELTKLQA